MTIGTLLDDFVDRSRTACLDSSAVVVEAVVVVANVVESDVKMALAVDNVVVSG